MRGPSLYLASISFKMIRTSLSPLMTLSTAAVEMFQGVRFRVLDMRGMQKGNGAQGKGEKARV